MTELTSELIERIAFHVLAGDHRPTAARMEGVRKADYQRLEKKGSDDLNEGVDSDEARLVSAVEVAEAQCEHRWLREIGEMVDSGRKTGRSNGMWVARMAQLERRFPERYARKLPGFAEGKTESPDEFFRKLSQSESKEKAK